MSVEESRGIVVVAVDQWGESEGCGEEVGREFLVLNYGPDHS